MVIVCFFKDRTRVLQPYQTVSVFTGYGLWDRKHIWFCIKTIKVNGKSPLWQKNKYVPACALSGQCYDDCLCISHSGSSHYFALIISTAHVHIHIHTHNTSGRPLFTGESQCQQEPASSQNPLLTVFDNSREQQSDQRDRGGERGWEESEKIAQRTEVSVRDDEKR